MWPSCPSLSLLSACSALEGPLRVSRTTSPGPLGLQRPPRTVPFSFTTPRGPHVSASPSLPFSFACFPFLAPSMALLRWQVAGPPRHLESARTAGNHRAPLPLPCTPQPPAYKAPDRAPPISPFPLLASSNSPPPAISLTRASILDADAPVRSATTRRSRRCLPFSISDSFCSDFPSPRPLFLSPAATDDEPPPRGLPGRCAPRHTHRGELPTLLVPPSRCSMR